jgi:hypothetical protein
MNAQQDAFRLDSFGLKDHLDAMTDKYAEAACQFAREVIADNLTTGVPVDDIVERVQREVSVRAVKFASLINLDGGSFTGVMEDAAVARGWAKVADDLQFTARSAVAAMAADNKPAITL